jgi:predicted AlkP superfamily phosphohydrolase/phosphomutase
MHWLKSWIQNYLAGSDIDWAKTYAFSRGKEGDIFINLKGRDPEGIVDEKDYDSVRNRIIESFLKLKNPSNGKNVVNKIYKREELYKGPYLEFAPDLLIDWVDSAYMPTESDKNKDSIFVERWRENMNWPTSGSHRIDGVFMANGPHIAENKINVQAGLLDLLPTWLHLLGQKIPDDLEGEIISGLLR